MRRQKHENRNQKKENEIKILSWFQPPPTYEAVHAFSTTDADAMIYSPACIHNTDDFLDFMQI